MIRRTFIARLTAGASVLAALLQRGGAAPADGLYSRTIWPDGSVTYNRVTTAGEDYVVVTDGGAPPVMWEGSGAAGGGDGWWMYGR